MKEFAEVMKALSDETRLRILTLLRERELCVCDLCEALMISQAKVSRHLAVLRSAGLVMDERFAQWMHYRMAEGWWLPFVRQLTDDILATSGRGKTDEKNLVDWLERKGESC